MKNFILSSILVISLPLFSFSQSVGINNDGSTPDGSAIVDVKSTTKGMLIPRMSTTQRNMIASPATGLLVFDIDFASFWFYNGTSWVNLSSSVGTSEIADADNDTKVQVEQTADEDSIKFMVQGNQIGSLDDKTFHLNSPGKSVFIGKDAGKMDDGSDSRSTGVGYESLKSNTQTSYKSWHGSDNTAIGFKAMTSNNIGEQNTSIGSMAFLENTNGSNNVAVGNESLRDNVSGDKNTALGSESLANNYSGTGNTAVGRRSLEANLGGNYNSAIGNQSLYQNTTGSYNIALGNTSLNKLDDGDFNIGLGNAALYNNIVGSYNIAVGRNALYNTTSDKNIAIGAYAAYNNSSGDKNIAIGDNALRLNTVKSNLVAIGDSSLYHNGSVNNGGGYAEKNTAVGAKAMYSNTDGASSTALGYEALKNNTTGRYNTAIGDEVLHTNTIGEYNVGVGSQSLKSNIEGESNVAVGVSALIDNEYGDRNLALGNASLANNTTGSDNVALGFAALNSNTTISQNVALGDSTLTRNGLGASADDGTLNTGLGSRALAFNEVGKQNTAVGSQSLYRNKYGNYNTAIGSQSLQNNVGGTNVAVGASTLLNSINGDGNNAMGYAALYHNDSGDNNSSFGKYASFRNTTGDNNIAIGGDANHSNRTGSNNTIVGQQAGGVNAIHNKSGNVFLGYQSGFSELGDNKLYIENSNSTSPLIYGEFDNDKLQINGELNINGNYTFPTVDGSNEQILTTNGSGNLSWDDLSSLEKWQPIAPASNDIKYTSGFVGIGTIAPSSWLHVNGFTNTGTFTVHGIQPGNKTGINVKTRNTSIVTSSDSIIGVQAKAYGSTGVNVGVIAEAGTGTGEKIGLIAKSETLDGLAAKFDGEVNFRNTLQNYNEVSIIPGSQNGTTSLFFSENYQNTIGMYWEYYGAGATNEMRLYGRSGSTTYGPHISVQRNSGLIEFGNNDFIFNPDHLGSGDSRFTTDEIEIRGGSDLAENFDITDLDVEPQPGMLVSIDPANPGKLKISTERYCPLLAGVISGANNIDPGLRMGQEGTIADGDYPITLSGRVYVRTNHSGGDISPGDLLTSSSIPGEAMKADRSTLEIGMAIGKALSSPDENNFVLVLISLQ